MSRHLCAGKPLHYSTGERQENIKRLTDVHIYPVTPAATAFVRRVLQNSSSARVEDTNFGSIGVGERLLKSQSAT